MELLIKELKGLQKQIVWKQEVTLNSKMELRQEIQLKQVKVSNKLVPLLPDKVTQTFQDHWPNQGAKVQLHQ